MKRLVKLPALIFAIIGIIKFPFAYIGPGSGLSALGALLAVIAGLGATIFGLFWYPIKRFFGKKKESKEPNPESDDEDNE